ncbi:hypothetical protein [Roseofilum casamattae]|uniref:Uncharacterized protein n=1 Tax=Roseofilum casamattae BLCC-M143 TaxID=3022442 RepID=A0ABT7C150_9CYAN|nr:hypothetical protein [Roseofilum casamattae]MDJ1185161.1 hypothetical protein [Roseofilum casamattae BLCC-M143]
MLSTELRQKSIVKKVQEVVSIVMEEHPLLKEDFDYAEAVQDLVNLFQKNLPFEEFNSMSNAELKEHCSFILATELFAKIGEDFTSEEMATFENAVRRN